jgi:hypothetical protein
MMMALVKSTTVRFLPFRPRFSPLKKEVTLEGYVQ